jgi:hypothetical protein
MDNKKIIKKQNTELKQYDLNDVKGLTQLANTLKRHIVDNNLFTPIQGKNYVQVEGWQFAGGLLGLIPRVVRLEDISREGEKRWLAEVEIVDRNDRVVSKGFAICSQKEMNRLRSDEYVLASMAQTRAIGKAYRNVIGWVMKLANYEPTPAEEIVNLGGKSVIEKEQELKEKQENMYEKILIVLGKENDIKRLEELKTKIETAKGLTEEQKGQLLDFVNSKIDGIKNNQK